MLTKYIQAAMKQAKYEISLMMGLSTEKFLSVRESMQML
jgi:hypothetical protein